jgi:putative addiction module component (TIGR02574 family)
VINWKALEREFWRLFSLDAGDPMTEVVEQLKSQIGTLSAKERADLAHFILSSLEPDDDEQAVATAWEAEVARRVDEIQAGQVVGIPADQLFEELRKQYP